MSDTAWPGVRFADYLRWDGLVAVILGAALFGLGLVQHRQGVLDALFSGVIMLAGTAAFMRVRHKLGPWAAGAWYTQRPLAAAQEPRTVCARATLVVRLAVSAAAGAAFVIACSVLTGFWLTYMDVGVWAVAVGLIKLGPATSAVAGQETSAGTTYLVAHRSWSGTVLLTRSVVAEVDHHAGGRLQRGDAEVDPVA